MMHIVAYGLLFRDFRDLIKMLRFREIIKVPAKISTDKVYLDCSVTRICLHVYSAVHPQGRSVYSII